MSSSFYDVLEVKNTASLEDIKASYKLLMLKNHPDKALRGYDKELVHRIQRAWETLKDEAKRKDYDQRLSIQLDELKACVYDEVQLSDFESVEEDEFHLGCRCGGEFFIRKVDMDSGFNLISCSNCSARTLVS